MILVLRQVRVVSCVIVCLMGASASPYAQMSHLETGRSEGVAYGQPFKEIIVGPMWPLGDLDADDVPDLAVAVKVRSSEGAAYFHSIKVVSGFDLSPLFYLPSTTSAVGAVVQLADVNGDGVGDIAASMNADSSESARILIYSGRDGSALKAVAAGAPPCRAASGGLIVHDSGKLSMFSRSSIPGVSPHMAWKVEAGQMELVIIGANDRVEEMIKLGIVPYGVAVANCSEHASSAEYFVIGLDGRDDIDARHGSSGTVFVARIGREGLLWVKKIDGISGVDLCSVASIPDSTGDGERECAVGLPYAGDGGNMEGQVRVYSGSSGQALFTLKGSTPNGGFGASVCLGPDIDDDGVRDFAVGEPARNSPPSRLTADSFAGGIQVRSGRAPYELLAEWNGTDDLSEWGSEVIWIGGSGGASYGSFIVIDRNARVQGATVGAMALIDIMSEASRPSLRLRE